MKEREQERKNRITLSGQLLSSDRNGGRLYYILRFNRASKLISAEIRSKTQCRAPVPLFQPQMRRSTFARRRRQTRSCLGVYLAKCTFFSARTLSLEPSLSFALPAAARHRPWYSRIYFYLYIKVYIDGSISFGDDGGSLSYDGCFGSIGMSRISFAAVLHVSGDDTFRKLSSEKYTALAEKTLPCTKKKKREAKSGKRNFRAKEYEVSAVGASLHRHVNIVYLGGNFN